MQPFINWNDRVVMLLEQIRNNGTPETDSTGAVNLKVQETLVSDANPVPISDGGGAITVDGAVHVGNFPAVQQVEGSLSVANFPQTQQVIGEVAIATLPAVEIEGAVQIANFPQTQQVTGTVAVSGEPTQPYSTDAELGWANTKVVKVGATALYALAVYNAKDSIRYFQIFDSATPPQTGDVPLESYPVPIDGYLLLDNRYFGMRGKPFSKGFTWGMSVSLGSFAPGMGTENHAVHVKYL